MDEKFFVDDEVTVLKNPVGESGLVGLHGFVEDVQWGYYWVSFDFSGDWYRFKEDEIELRVF
jgi:hypothetical protein